MDALAGGEAGFGDPAPRGAGGVADVVGQDHPPPVPKSPGDLWMLAYQSKLPPLLRAVKFDGDGRIKELDFYNKSEPPPPVDHFEAPRAPADPLYLSLIHI